MMTSRNLFRFGLFLLMAIACILSALIWGRPSRSNRQRLPDGSVLELRSVSFGTNYTYRAPPLRPWQRVVDRFMPGWLAGRLNWVYPQGAITLGSQIGGPCLSIFTACQELTGGSFSGARLQILDDHERVFDLVSSSATLSAGSPGAGACRIDGWVISAFPRRSKTLTLFFVLPPTAGGAKPTPQFTVTNPAYGEFASWSPESLPATKVAVNLPITLNRFTSHPIATSNPGENAAVTEMEFQIQQNADTGRSWRPKKVEFSDATGNQWSPFPEELMVFDPLQSAEKRASEDGAVSWGVRFYHGLWPGETAWKLRVEFSRVSYFGAEELWTQVIPVPMESEAITLGASTNIFGVRLQWLTISGPKAEQPGNLKWAAVKSLANISVRITPMPNDTSLTIVQVLDERGRFVGVKPTYLGRASEMVYGLEIPPGATELKITTALHQSRFAEFMVGPDK